MFQGNYHNLLKSLNGKFGQHHQFISTFSLVNIVSSFCSLKFGCLNSGPPFTYCSLQESCWGAFSSLADNTFYLLSLNNAKTRCVLFSSWMRRVTGEVEKKWKFVTRKVARGALFLRDTQIIRPSGPSLSHLHLAGHGTACRGAVDRLLFCHTRLTFPNFLGICAILYILLLLKFLLLCSWKL